MKKLKIIYRVTIILIFLVFVVNAQTVSTLNSGLPNNGGIAVNRDGNIFTANFNSSVVWKVTREGNPTIFATGFQTLSGNYVDADGNLYQTNNRD